MRHTWSMEYGVHGPLVRVPCHYVIMSWCHGVMVSFCHGVGPAAASCRRTTGIVLVSFNDTFVYVRSSASFSFTFNKSVIKPLLFLALS
jgi:hypothetical protein